MRLKHGVAIAGTHGKTTTTSLVASVLAEGGLDPTFVIGGRLNAAGSNARLGQGDYIVVEADESDASFLHLQPVLAVVTNIDADHMETYQHDFARLKQAFVQFLQNLPFYGSAILCADDANVREILPFVSKPLITYGFAADAMLRAREDRPRRRPHALQRAAREAAGAGGDPQPAGRAQRAQRARGDRGRHRAGRRGRGDPQGAGGVPRRRPALPALWRRAPRGRRQLHADRRLRPSPGGNGGDARRRARRVSRAAHRARLPAAPLYAHARPVRGLRARALDRGRGAAGRGLSRRARRRSSPPTAARWRAPCAWRARWSRCSSRRSRRWPRRSGAWRRTATWC